MALVLLLVTAVFVALKGGLPERFGVAMIVTTWIGTIVAQYFTHLMTMSFLVFDGLLAVGFLVVAVRYSSLWLGGAMICQAISFGAHAMRLSDNTRIVWRGANVYLLVTNVASYMILFILIGGTCASIQNRRKAARARVEDRARIVKRPDWLTDATPPTAGVL
ncbi:MAG TPA: hypothetical protein VHY32_09485 [Caulobacteraceae bacterium]|nr:hypothetical protein [Caulobacteraceae bacterium]